LGLFAQFSYLQLLDLLSTLAFLSRGVGEANPVVRLAIGLAPSPLQGLAALKLFAILLGLYCWHSGRVRVLERMNVFFAALVFWNIAMLTVQAFAP
jgi:hypothetical protein